MKAALLIVSSTVLFAPGDLSGRWQLEFQREPATAVYVADCLWEQEDARLSGGCTSGFESFATIAGTVADSEIAFSLSYDAQKRPTVMRFSGRMDRAGSIRGTWHDVDTRNETAGGTFTATKR